MLLVLLLCIFTQATNENLKSEIIDAVRNQMKQEYTKQFHSHLIQNNNITKAREDRLKQLKGTIVSSEAKKVNITKKIEGVEAKIKELKKEMVNINTSIQIAKQNAAREKKDITIELRQKVRAYQKARKQMKLLEEKREELNEAKLEVIRAMSDAKQHINDVTEQMRNRRRFLNDLEEKHNRRKRTHQVVSKVRAIEYKKLIARIRELENAKDEIRRLEAAQEMKQKAMEKKEAKIRAENERKRKILATKLKAAKIAKNAELIATVYRQLAELKRYKMTQIRCARKAFEQYKEKQRIEIEKKKAKLIDGRLKAEFKEKKGEYLMNVRREIQDKIDELRLEKELFEHERRTEEKKLKAFAKIQEKEIKDSKRRLRTKKMLMKLKREELLRQRMRTMISQSQEYDNKSKRNILQKAVDASKRMIEKTDRMNEKMRRINAEVRMKKKILGLRSQDATIASARERLEIQKLKDQYYKLQALKQRQKMQFKANKAILKHVERMDNLEEAERQGNLGMLTALLKRRGVQRSIIRHAKLNAAAEMELLKQQMRREYELRKKVMNLKRCLRTRLALNSEIKRKQFEAKLREMIKQALINKIRSAQLLKCKGHNRLAKKVSK